MSEKIQYPCFATHAGPSVKPAAAEQAVPQSVRQAGRAALWLTAWWPDGLQGGQGRTESVRDEAGCSVRIDEGCSRRCVKDLHSRRRHLAVESVAHVRTWVSAAGSAGRTPSRESTQAHTPDPRARCDVSGARHFPSAAKALHTPRWRRSAAAHAGAMVGGFTTRGLRPRVDPWEGTAGGRLLAGSVADV